MSTFAKLQELAEEAKPIQTGNPREPDDWGSTRQLAAEIDFFDYVNQHYPEVMSDEFESFCLKATTEEMVDEAVANAGNI